MPHLDSAPVRLKGEAEDKRHLRVRGEFSESASDPRPSGRHDRDRLLYARSLLRLSGVTQVLTPSDEGAFTHNRLTHTIKVAQVARSLAELLLAKAGDDAKLRGAIVKLGGLDADVVEAAALAHDLGHPPFGHIGEDVLDRYARHKLGLEEGFEGNAQSFRILATLEPRSATWVGVDAAAATLAATNKYPWRRLDGKARRSDGPPKFGYYKEESDAYDRARAWLPAGYPKDAQTLEAAVMDLADDITYALHDFDDFRAAGIISLPEVRAELLRWKDLYGSALQQGHAVEDGANLFGALRARLADDKQYDSELFVRAVDSASSHLHALTPTSGEHWRVNMQNARRFTSTLITQFTSEVELNKAPSRDDPPLKLRQEHWHLIQILKQVTRDFVISRPDVAALQRGQQRQLELLLTLLDKWGSDPDDCSRAPAELRSLVERHEKRGLIDYVAGLSDARALALLHALCGEGAQTVLRGLAL